MFKYCKEKTTPLSEGWTLEDDILIVKINSPAIESNDNSE